MDADGTARDGRHSPEPPGQKKNCRCFRFVPSDVGNRTKSAAAVDYDVLIVGRTWDGDNWDGIGSHSFQSMIPKKPAPDLIRSGYRFSERSCSMKKLIGVEQC